MLKRWEVEREEDQEQVMTAQSYSELEIELTSRSRPVSTRRQEMDNEAWDADESIRVDVHVDTDTETDTSSSRVRVSSREGGQDVVVSLLLFQSDGMPRDRNEMEECNLYARVVVVAVINQTRDVSVWDRCQLLRWMDMRDTPGRRVVVVVAVGWSKSRSFR